GLGEPGERLRAVILVVFVKAQSKGGSGAPNIAGVCFGKGGKPIKGAGSRVAQRTRQNGKFPLSSFIVGRGCYDLKHSRVRSTPRTARYRLGSAGFLPLMVRLTPGLRRAAQTEKCGQQSTCNTPGARNPRAGQQFR